MSNDTKKPSNVKRIEEVYRFLPPIDSLLRKNKGIKNNKWIGLVGEPGAFKTVFTRWAMKKWLEWNPKTVVIYAATEENNRSIRESLEDYGIDVEKYIRENRLRIGSVFCFSSEPNEKIKSNPQGIVEFVHSSIVDLVRAHRSMSNIRIMLVIDSMASFWSHAPATSRQVWEKIYGSLFHKIDIGLMTFQLAGSTGKAFGWGAEHGVDMLFRFGKYCIDGDSAKRYFVIDKTRSNESEDGRIYKSRIGKKGTPEEGEFILDGLLPSRGKYASAKEAIDGLKYENEQDIQRERNEILDKLYIFFVKKGTSFMKLFKIFASRKKKGENE